MLEWMDDAEGKGKTEVFFFYLLLRIMLAASRHPCFLYCSLFFFLQFLLFMRMVIVIIGLSIASWLQFVLVFVVKVVSQYSVNWIDLLLMHLYTTNQLIVFSECD